MNFAIKQIKDLCTKITDGSHFSPEDDANGRYEMYSVKDMEYNGFNNADCKHVGDEMFNKLSRGDCRPLKNDILIAKDGSYLKYVFKCDETLDSCILSSIAILRPNLKVINPDYFVYLLRTQSIKSAMANYVSGSALPRIILSDFKKMKIKMIDDIAYQQKIAKILLNYDKLIENNNKRIKILEEIAESVFKEWFIRLRFPSHENFTFSNGKPDGWKKCKLRDIAHETGRPIKKEQRNSFDYYLPIDCIPNRAMMLQNYDDIENAESSLESFSNGNILFGAMRTYFHKVIIAPFDGITRSTCFVISANNVKYQNFLYLFLYQDSTIDYSSTVSVGSTMPYVRWKDLNRISLVLPDEITIEKFNKVVEPMLKEIRHMFFINENLKFQRDALLPRLMSGKLSVEGKEIV